MIRDDDRSVTRVQIFSSHFYSTLVEDGADGVTSWTMKKGIDIFSRKLIFVPSTSRLFELWGPFAVIRLTLPLPSPLSTVNKSLHWSLCVVVNPGHIDGHADRMNGDEDEFSDMPMPCLLFFDSLKAHQKNQVRKNVIRWLNSEWNRLGKGPRESPFSAKNMKILAPKSKLGPCACYRFFTILLQCLSCVRSPVSRQHLGLRCICLSLCLRCLPTSEQALLLQ